MENILSWDGTPVNNLSSLQELAETPSPQLPMQQHTVDVSHMHGICMAGSNKQSAAQLCLKVIAAPAASVAISTSACGLCSCSLEVAYKVT